MPPLRVIPLGGLGEIGKNMLLLEYGDDMVAVDAGVMFPKEEMLGVDLVIPNTAYVLERKDRLRGIVVTHGHEDHIGALPYVLGQANVPVYASRLTHGLITVRLREARRLKQAELHQIEPGDVVELGAFSVEFFRVCHSIPDAMGLAIRTPVGTVVHTGDFKFDHTPVDGKRSDFAKLARIGAEGVLLLLSDSTYAEVPGYTPSEQVVSGTLDRVIGEARGRVIIATFASLISRVQQVVDAAVKHGRKVGVVGRSMVDNVQMAIKLGYLRIPESVLAKGEELRDVAREKTVIVTTGAQGEPTSALVRMASRDHREVTIVPGDTVIISATPIPGNEVLVSRTIDNLFRLGARVLYDKVETVHVHGHAAQEELKAMISLIKPRYFVPIHGEYRHMELHRDLAESLGMDRDHTFVLTDGEVLEIDETSAIRAGRVPADYIYVDGLGIGDVDDFILRDRAHLASEGLVVFVVAIDHNTGRLARPPEVMSHGFVGTEEAPALVDGVRDLVASVLGGDEPAVDWRQLHDSLRQDVAEFLQRRTHRRPLVIPVMLEV